MSGPQNGVIEGTVFTGCLECGERSDENWERHKPTCSQVDKLMAEGLLDDAESDEE